MLGKSLQPRGPIYFRRRDGSTVDSAGRRRFEAWLGLDLRSLALMRMGAGVTLLVDLAMRSRYLETFYSDDGVVPRQVLSDNAWWSLLEFHALGGSSEFQGVLFGVAALAALALTLGLQTRIATVLCWALTVSLHARNPYIMLGFDHLLRIVLFWSMFLPLGARWSIDARRGTRPARQPNTVVSVATAVYLLQLGVMYTVAGLVKTDESWRQSFTAIEWVIRDSSWAWPHAAFFLQFPDALRVLTVVTMLLEHAGVLLLLCPVFSGPVRTLGVMALMALQLGIGTSMQLYLFPVGNLVALVAALPTWFWERWSPAEESPDPGPSSIPSPLRWLRDGFLGACAVWVVWINFATPYPALEPADWVRWPGYALGLHQRWELYGPGPRRVDKQSLFLGTTRRGEIVDVSTPAPGPHWQVVQSIESDYRYRLLTVFSLDKAFPAHPYLRPAYAEWICRSWNADVPRPRQLVDVKLISVLSYMRLRKENREPRAFLEFEYPCPGS